MTTTNETTTDASTANFVYLRSEEHAWIPARVIDEQQQQSSSSEGEEDKVTVKIPVYKSERQIVSDGGRTAQRFRKETIALADYPNHALPLQNVDENGKLVAVEDMVDLSFLHEVCMYVCVRAITMRLQRPIEGVPSFVSNILASTLVSDDFR